MSDDMAYYLKSYFRIGNQLIVRKKPPYEIAQKIVDRFPWVEGVYFYQAIRGEERVPQIIHLAGKDKPDVMHKENGVFYLFNIYQTMLSPGNTYLRKLLVDITSLKENLLDMFAAVGNLSLQPTYYNNCNLIAVEKSSSTFKSLQKTMKFNGILPKKLVNIDSRRLQLKNWADTVFLGYHNLDFKHVQTAVKAAKSYAKLHFHPIAKKGAEQDWIDIYSRWISSCGATSEVDDVFHVKKFSPGQSHYLIVISIRK